MAFFAVVLDCDYLKGGVRYPKKMVLVVSMCDMLMYGAVPSG